MHMHMHMRRYEDAVFNISRAAMLVNCFSTAQVHVHVHVLCVCMHVPLDHADDEEGHAEADGDDRDHLFVLQQRERESQHGRVSAKESAAAAIRDFLIWTKTLECFNISYCNFDYDECVILHEGIKGNESMKCLHISGNGIEKQI